MSSITRSGTPKNLRAQLDKRVLVAVEHLLAEGLKYTEISVARILEEAGIARSTFYVHFRDKTDLLKRLAGTLRQDLLKIAGEWRPERGLDTLIPTFEGFVAYHRKHAAVLSAITEAAGYDEGIRDFYTADLDGFVVNLRGLLQAEVAAGRTDPELSIEAACRVIIWGGESAMAHHVQIDDGAGDREFAAEMARMWWYGAIRRHTTTS